MTTEMSHVAQLAVFIRDTNDNFQLMEELLQVVPMQEKAGADEFLSHFVHPVNRLKLLMEKMVGFVNDGSLVSIVKNNGIVATLKTQ
jgi:hypothetical protein